MRIPGSTYRFQMNKDFRFDDARRFLDYLQRLGISDVYTSPIFRARPGSTHGYDVVDPTELNPEIGSQADFDEMVSELHDRGMGLLMDIVPNHMAVSLDNPWWYDLLENGQLSPFAGYFDIDWVPSSGIVHNKVILPILRTAYAEALEGARFKLFLDENGFAVDYYGMRLPLEVTTTKQILNHAQTRLPEEIPAAGSIQDAINHIDQLRSSNGSVSENARAGQLSGAGSVRSSREETRRHFWKLYQSDNQVKEAVDLALRDFNGRKGDPESFDAIDRLLNSQWYRLTFWRTALENINYRRFFNISDLVSVRAEERPVFASTHRLVFDLVREGKATGLRIDHIDGLHDPCEYLLRLQPSDGEGGPVEADMSVFVVVEKILIGDEPLPDDWLACGTTGYDFLNVLNGLFVDPVGLSRLRAFYSEFTGLSASFADVEYEKKKFVISRKFDSEFRSLQDRFNRLAAQDRYARDVSRRELERALLEVTACLPVYRTYVRSYQVGDRDREVLEGTVQDARRRNPTLSAAALKFARRLFTLDFRGVSSERQRESWLRYVMRWQQFTGPIAAKGVEDSALYVYNCLLSMNEVGGNPGVGFVSVPDFHRHNQMVREKWACTLNATSTHDTKRGEDARARLNVLSELSETWMRRLARWSSWNKRLKHQVDGKLLPDANQEVLLYQTLLGAWPLDPAELRGFPDRLMAFVEKAMREAQTYSNWRRPNEANETAVKDFGRAIIQQSDSNHFLPDFLEFQREIAFYGAINGLSQVVLKIVSPGIPDIYQGNELWNFSMVDPDNRRAVDFKLRQKKLKEIDKSRETRELAARLLSDWQDGLIKMFVTSRALRFRLANEDTFLKGVYHHATTSGHRRDFLCGLARERNGSWVLAAVPRLPTNLTHAGQFPLGEGVWEDTVLVLPLDTPRRWRNIFTDETVESREAGPHRVVYAAAIFSTLPVAILTNDDRVTDY